ncbi:proline--tRNA ligase [bacterium DOLZORAL124_38_8]|nr:MAG: proline--tRNA ligase [bacterium DOLZORAL124_38_8]
MRYSNYSITTNKETSSENAVNAQLLTKAGFIRKTLAGAYTFLPMGLKVLRNIEQIVREEMESVGCQEMLMPSLVPKENWVQTGRWDTVDVLYKMTISDGKEVALAPTHEETVTPLMNEFLNSHKNFPASVYQFQTKFRNEPRAKSGLLRGREFLMKDAYSFHTSQECLDEYYEKMATAYHRVYERLGLGDITKYVYASGGDFSQFSHEFQTISPIGEDEIYYIPSEDKYLNKEIVASQAPKVSYQDETEKPMETVVGENITGLEAIAEFLNIEVERTTKTVMFTTETGQLVAAAVRSGYDIDEHKLQTILGCESLTFATDEQLASVGTTAGYVGIIGLPASVKIICDESMENRLNFEMGSNEKNKHLINVNWNRDVEKPAQFYDIKTPKPGDFYPKTGEKYEVMNAVEVGNIFKLGTKFTDAFKFNHIAENGKSEPVVMGCYGIGISRVMGVIAEIFADEKGLVWPQNIAPYQVYLAVFGKNQELYDQGTEIYETLQNAGITVFFDDRQGKKFGPGVKLGDFELMGMPKCVVLSDRIENGKVEIIDRKTGDKELVEISQLVSKLS